MYAHVKYYALLILLFFSVYSYNQTKTELISSDSLINRAIRIMDEGEDYSQAIAQLKHVSELDENYIRAQYEMALAYYRDKKYEKTKEILEKIKSEEQFYDDHLYGIIYASSLDELNEKEKAIEEYQELLKKFPNDYLIYYNMGVTYNNLKQYDKAFEVLKKAIELDPSHTSSHYLLGTIAIKTGELNASVMPMTTYSLLKAGTTNSFQNLLELNKALSEKYKEPEIKASPHGKDREQQYKEVEEFLRNQYALSNKYDTGIKEINEPFVKQMHLYYQWLKDYNPQGGFYDEIYTPFYQELVKKGHFNALIYVSLSGLNDESLNKLISKNKKSIESFFEWFKEDGLLLLTKRNDPKTGQELNVLPSNGGTKYMGKFVDNKKEGLWTTYYESGEIAQELNYKNGEIVGQEKGYFPNGKLKGIFTYVNGKVDGPYENYRRTGVLRENGIFKEDGYEGLVTTYYPGGVKQCEIRYSEKKKNGKMECFYTDGTPKKHYNFKDDLPEGKFIDYYSDGKIKIETNYKKGYYDGEYKEYYSNGTLKEKKNYREGKEDGIQTLYYPNEKIHIQYETRQGTPVHRKSYNELGNLERETPYNSSGNIDGIDKFYDYNGVLEMELLFSDDVLKTYKIFDTDGLTVLQEKKIPSNEVVEYYDRYYLKSKGSKSKRNFSGDWTYFYPNGSTKSKSTYDKDGNETGKFISYHRNGKISEEYYYEKGKLEGEYISYYPNGKIKRTGSYKNGEQIYEWAEYNPEGKIESKYFISSEKEIQRHRYYYPDTGGIQYDMFYEDGEEIREKLYDYQGKLVYDIDFTKSKTQEVTIQGPNGSYTATYPLKNGNFQGKLVRKDKYGKPMMERSFINGEMNGKEIFFNFNNKLKSSEETYFSRLLWGTNKEYDFDGNLKLISEYKNNSEFGLSERYYYNGKKLLEALNFNNRTLGETKYYSMEGDHLLSIFFNESDPYAYQLIGADGKPKEKILFKEGNASIVAYHRNGKKAIEMDYKNGERSGKFNVYSSDEKPLQLSTFQDGLIQGERTTYYLSGSLYGKETFDVGEYNGVTEVYYENGKIKSSASYLYDALNGKSSMYSPEGKIIESRVYYDGVLHEISK